MDGLKALTAASGLPIVASGGIGSLEELRSVACFYPEGVRGAIVGRALYEHKFNVGEANLATDAIASGKEEVPLEGEFEGR